MAMLSLTSFSSKHSSIKTPLLIKKHNNIFHLHIDSNITQGSAVFFYVAVFFINRGVFMLLCLEENEARGSIVILPAYAESAPPCQSVWAATCANVV